MRTADARRPAQAGPASGTGRTGRTAGAAATSAPAGTDELPGSADGLHVVATRTADDVNPTTAVVVTGIGVVAPTGLGLEEHWQATLAGRNTIGPLERFDTTRYPAHLAGQVVGFDAEQLLPARLLPQTDPGTRLSLVAAEWALADASVDLATVPELERGVVTASSAGGYEFGQRELQKLWSQGSRHVSAYQSFAWFYAVNTGQIGIRHRMRGPCGVVVSDHAGGLDAIGQARRTIRHGSRLMLTGAVDSALAPWGWLGHLAGGRISDNDLPDRCYLPFDADASGYVPGEGGAILAVESAETARSRGIRRPYGQIRGYAAGLDPRAGSVRPPCLRAVMLRAIDDAGLEPGDIDVVFADACGVPDQDRVEADALAAVFGPAAVPVTAPKTMTGRLCSGGAPLDVATALLAIRDGLIPPTINVRVPAPGTELDLVLDRPRSARLDNALVVARGRGGFTSAMVVSRAPELPDVPRPRLVGPSA